MRWLFLLLVVLNIFYYVWRQQEAPPRVKEVASLALYKGSKQDIQLLKEVRPIAPGVEVVAPLSTCFHLTLPIDGASLSIIRQRLADTDVASELTVDGGAGAPSYLFKISAQGDEKKPEVLLQNLANEFNDFKYEKKDCGGLQRPDSLHRMAPAPQ